MNPKGNLEDILESVIVVSSGLICGAHTGLIHIEYGITRTGTLDYLKVFWSSLTRGRWLLACEYWISANTFHGIGIRFNNGYESEGLARILEFVMQHQNSFVLSPNRGRQGLLQSSTATEEKSSEAAISVNEAKQMLAQPAVA